MNSSRAPVHKLWSIAALLSLVSVFSLGYLYNNAYSSRVRHSEFSDRSFYDAKAAARLLTIPRPAPAPITCACKECPKEVAVLEVIAAPGQKPVYESRPHDSDYWLELTSCEFGSQKCQHNTRWWDGSPLFRERLSRLKDMHGKAIDPNSGIPADDRKFLIFSATNDGLGNKFLPLISSFVAAILMNRTFLVDWTGRDPFARHILWDRNPGAVADFFESPTGHEWRYEVVADALQNVVDIRADEILVDMRTPDYREVKMEWLCSDVISASSKATAVRIAGDQYFLPLLAANPLVKDRIAALFSPGNVFGPVARYLLKPVPWIRERILAAQAQFGDYTIGLQLRRREGIGLKGGELDKIWQCASHLRKVFGPVDGSKVKFVVASDDPSSGREAQDRLGKDSVIYFDHNTDRNSIEGVKWGIVEILSLSATDDMITTPHSTFGYSAHAFGSIVPFRVENEPFTNCLKMFTPDPHAHFWGPLFNERRIKPEVSSKFCIDSDDSFFQTEGPPRWN